MTRDELKAREWADIAVQYHQKAEAKGIAIPFPDLCFCIGRPHKYGEAPNRELVTREGSKGLVETRCPVISRKTHALRVKMIGEAIGATDAR
jgi:hypothetical protein